MNIFLYSLLLCLLSQFAFADNDFVTLDTLGGKKNIKLMKIDEQKAEINFNKLKFYWEKDTKATVTSFSKSQTAVEVGMNNVPVLDQGNHGTCVTFATTAAINAVLNLGDYISQQCTLEMLKATGADLWHGAYTPLQVTEPLAQYGAVSKSDCPRAYPDRFSAYPLSDYLAIANKLKPITATYNANITPEDAKNAINNGRRVLIGFGLLANSQRQSVQGYDVKVDKEKRKKGGYWACMQASTNVFGYFCGKATAGHEVVITGYDDEQQLFKIRNSWDTKVGDDGEFYMTYTFFENMVIDGTEIY